MNREQIIQMAREARFEELGPGIEYWVCFTEEIERFFQAAYAAGAAAEREACAKICEEQYEYYGHDHIFAKAIRARGNT